MAKEVSRLDPEIVIPKIKNFKGKLFDILSRRKKLAIVVILALLIVGFVSFRQNFRTNTPSSVKAVTQQVDKSFTFNALTNQGRISGTKIKFRIVDAQKTDEVLVKDQTYTAKNNKTFLIVNLELRNDETVLENIIPGDLVRLAVIGSEDTRYAPDLHNSLVGIAAISTKTDRIGFVIPKEAKQFKLYVGELEGKKEEVKIDFPS